MKRKLRNEAIVVEAVQLDPWTAHKYSLPDGVKGVPSYSADNWAYAECRFFIDTLEGRVEVKPGDWIITGIDGKISGCDDRVFESTYEEIISE